MSSIWGLTGEVAYVGNTSNDVLEPLQHQRRHDGRRRHRPGSRSTPSSARRAAVENLAWKGKTRYNGLQVKLDRRFRNGWLVTNSYTYGSAWDYANDNGGPSTPADPELQLGPRELRPQAHLRVVVRVVAALVQEQRRRGPALRPRQLAAVGHLHRPVGPGARHHVVERGVLNTPGNTQRPNMTGDYKILEQLRPRQDCTSTRPCSRRRRPTRSAT